MFHNIDTDEDKIITREELEKSLVRVGSNLGSEEIKTIAEAVRILKKKKTLYNS